MTNRPIRVLCVDDSSFVRKVLNDALSKEPDMQVVGCARDPIEARDIILKTPVDVMTLDIEMPRMDGITFLKQLMANHPMPVVMLSALTSQGGEMAMRALHLGAVDVMGKPNTLNALRALGGDLAEKVRAAAQARLVQPDNNGFVTKPSVPSGGTFYRRSLLLLGASTGGTEALRQVFGQLPADTPGTLVVQHMPPHFTSSFARSLDKESAMTVREAKDGDKVVRGTALIAPGGYHMVVEGTPQSMRVRIKEGPMVCHQKPAVDVLFKSAARSLSSSAVAAIFTGMGSDGAAGLYALKSGGCRTVAQDEASSVVYGMPRAAFETGAVDQVLSLTKIPEALLTLLTR